IAAVALVSYVRTSAGGRIGATTEVAALATFLLGALAGAGELVVAGAAGVTLAVLLVGKPRLEAFSNALTTEEIVAALELAVLASAIMCVRMAVLAGAVDLGILPRLLPVLAVMALVGGAAAWLVGRGRAGRTPSADDTLTNPFSLRAALTFAAVYALVTLAV